jgi:3-oxoadipate CoA-transferase alpha subunit
MITNICASTVEALADLSDGATVMIGCSGLAGQPMQPVDALLKPGSTDLTVLSKQPR